MARELTIEAVFNSTEAEGALSRFALALTAAGDKAEVAADKVAKFEKSYKEGKARQTAKAELDALSASTDKVGTAAAKAATPMDALGRVALRIAGPAAVGAAITSTLNWADQLSNLSRSTGISTTALQKFESIGKTSGTTMEQIANASLQLSNRLAGGDKSAASAAAKLGLNVQTLINLSPDQAMLAWAAALSKVQNPQERVALAMDGMGRTAGNLLPVLMDMNDQWDRTTAKLTTDGVKSLDDAGDALDRLLDTGKGLLATVLVPFAPLLEGILTVLTPLSKLFSAFMRDVLSPFNPAAWREWADSLRDAARSMQYIAGIGPGIIAPPPPLPSAPGGAGWMPTPAGAIPLPSNLGIGGPGRIRSGSSGSSGGGSGGASILPFVPRTFNNTLGSMFPTSIPAFPGWAPGNIDASFQGFNGVGFAPTVGMNPAGGGGFSSFFSKNKGTLGLLAGGLAAQFLPGKVGSFAQGAMGMAGQGAGIGAMFGPHGAAIGAGIGALVGGIGSLFGGGKSKKDAKNAEISQVFEQFSTKEFIALQKEADRLGVSLDKALNAKTMKDFSAATAEAAEKLDEMRSIEEQIADLTARTTVDFDKMNAVVKEFGLDVSKMGPAFQQASADKEIQKIIDAMAIMEKGGADMNGVLDGMADEISKVVQDSLKFGTTIPENMKPYVAKLIESGKLLDENGQAITDISKVKWGAAMESDMSKLTKKLDELIQKLAEMADAFGKVKKEAEGLGNVDVGGGPGTGGGGNTDNGAGFATSSSFRRPGGGDGFASGAAGVTVGNVTINGSYRSRSQAVETIGDAIVAYAERRGARFVA